MGIFDKLTNTFNFNGSKNSEFIDVLNKLINEQSEISQYFYSVTMGHLLTYKNTVSKWENTKKVEFISYLFQVASETDKYKYSSNDHNNKRNLMSLHLIQALLRTKMDLTEAEIDTLKKEISAYKKIESFESVSNWMFTGFVKQVEHNYLGKKLPGSAKAMLEEILNTAKLSNAFGYKEKIKLDERIKLFLFASENPENKISPSLFLGKDQFSGFANEIIESQVERERYLWYQLTALSGKSTGSKPTAKFLNESQTIVKELGVEKFHEITNIWFQYLINLKEVNKIQTYTYGGKEHEVQVIEYLDNLNTETIKGFIWISSLFYDQKKILTLGKLAERFFRKIPNKGQAAPALGNACLYTLYAVNHLEGVTQLSKLKLLVNQVTTVSLIEKYLNESANQIGMTTDEIEDLSVEDFNLKDYQLTYQIEDFTYQFELIGIGKSTVRWFKNDGSEQKTIPQLIKTKHPEKLKSFKEEQKYIEQTSSIQKERLDRMLRSTRKFSISYFSEKYCNHGLLSFVIKNVIFNFTNENESKLAIFVNRQWIDLNYNKIDINRYNIVSIWHPVNSSADEVKEWRQFLMDSQLQQPIKQAYREIYLLTEAEMNTRTYSNRMASHILKQHQYVSLAKNRNWKAKLMGAWDGGDQDTAELYLPDFKLKVQYWVNALDAETQYNETGIWNYVTTDQIRFINSESNDVIELIDVPRIAFSEAMRDVDLFVGVASVGNDPTWSDSGGLKTHRDYWHSYSFGDLSEIAKNRKEILRNLIPKLKIAQVSTIEDKFLIVKGKLRTYKIHIGSTNILMEPNNQYLCIVPDRSLKDATHNVFLPFEGDNGLSVIISKAFLLANDDQISDKTITSQIIC